jgi:ketosteroid isomerase-like protein
MKRIACLVLSAVALTAASNDPKMEKDVLAAMESFRQAMIHNDAAALQKLLSDDLSYVHSAGQNETKADVLKSVTTGKNVITRLEFSDTSVRFIGDTALVRGRVDLWHSDTNIVHMNILHVWAKRPQGWQLVARQATRLAK